MLRPPGSIAGKRELAETCERIVCAPVTLVRALAGRLHPCLKFMAHLKHLLRLVILTLFVAGAARADEGMWTFDAFPLHAAEQAMGVRLERTTLSQLESATVRLTSGCSGAVVSPRGLVLTNQHCLLNCAQSVSAPGADLLREGFLAVRYSEERICPGVQAEILDGIDDITAQVFAASAKKTGDDFVAARQSAFAQAERKACGDDKRLRCQVVSFFGGGQFKLYRYRVFRDVRLVFLPEFSVGFFGGDPDNYSFPRYALDGAFLRLYDSGGPAETPAFLPWSTSPPKAGQPVLVAGSPGATDRSLTLSQLATQRDVVIPATLAEHEKLREALAAFAATGPEAAAAAQGPLFTQDNLLKLIRGRAAALRDAEFMGGREAQEARYRALVAAAPKLAAVVGDPWSEVAAVQKVYAAQYPVWRALEAGAGGGSNLFVYARMLVRQASERAKPDPQRLPEYAEARLALTEKAVSDDQPIWPGLEETFLRVWLENARDALGAQSLANLALLNGEEPKALAARLVAGTRLASPAYRRKLWNADLATLAAQHDAMIDFVLKTDPFSRAAREVWEDEVIGPTDNAARALTLIRLEHRVGPLYPDANFSPRLTYGKVQGWSVGGATIEPFTNLAGLFGRETGVSPYRLPERWRMARNRIDGNVVLNFTTTNDITGGNSGSPVVDARGRLLGAAFDGNQGSIAGDFAYDPMANRTVVLSTAAFTEALRKVYGASALLLELGGG